MNRYELTYIIDTVLEETARKELIERFSGIIVQNGGEVEKVDETWGKRRLAYPINDMLEGYYVLVTFKSEGDLPREIQRNLEINDHVLRYLIIKLEEKKHSVKPRPVRTPAPVAPAAFAPAAPASEAPAADVQAPVVAEVAVEVVEVVETPAAPEATEAAPEASAE